MAAPDNIEKFREAILSLARPTGEGAFEWHRKLTLSGIERQCHIQRLGVADKVKKRLGVILQVRNEPSEEELIDLFSFLDSTRNDLDTFKGPRRIRFQITPAHKLKSSSSSKDVCLYKQEGFSSYKHALEERWGYAFTDLEAARYDANEHWLSHRGFIYNNIWTIQRPYAVLDDHERIYEAGVVEPEHSAHGFALSMYFYCDELEQHLDKIVAFLNRISLEWA